MKYWHTALQPWFEHIVYELPYFNASRGHNHLFPWVEDNGLVCDDNRLPYFKLPAFRRTVDPMILVTYNGVHDRTGDRQILHPTKFRRHCFNLGHDITMPQWNSFHLRKGLPTTNWPAFLALKAMSRHNMHYRGIFRAAGLCSKRVRPWFHGWCRCELTIGRRLWITPGHRVPIRRACGVPLCPYLPTLLCPCAPIVPYWGNLNILPEYSI